MLHEHHQKCLQDAQTSSDRGEIIDLPDRLVLIQDMQVGLLDMLINSGLHNDSTHPKLHYDDSTSNTQITEIYKMK